MLEDQKSFTRMRTTNIGKAEEYFFKKVPLVDVMNTMKDIKELLPSFQKLEEKVVIQEDKITDLMMLNQ